MEPEPNQIYHVNHSRKGKFTMRVDSVKGEWVSGQELIGLVLALAQRNKTSRPG